MHTLSYLYNSKYPICFSVLKDVPAIPAESYGPRQRDSVRLSVFPNLNYSGLYQAVMNILDVVPVILHGQIGL